MEVGEVLEPLFASLAANRPFAEVSRLAVVSKTWRRVSFNALKTAHQLILSGFAESVTAAGFPESRCMEDILQSMTCSCVKSMRLT